MSFVRETLFRTADPVVFLRRLLAFDAATSGAMGVMLIVGAGVLGPLLGIAEAHLVIAGAILVPFAAAVALLAARPAPGRGATWAVVAVNALWAVESIALIAIGYLSPNALGMAFVVAQAAFVALLAELQAMALRQSA